MLGGMLGSGVPRLLTATMLACLWPVVAGAQEPVSAPLKDLCARFTGLDMDGDGHVEIESLEPWSVSSAVPGGPRAGRVLVLVEQRLLPEGTPVPEGGALDASVERRDWLPQLRGWAEQLGREGLAADIVTVRLQAAGAARHQDGRTLLALRRFVQACAGSADLRGVVLVGRFPDALLVRSVNWRKRGRLVTGKGTKGQRVWDDVEYLRRVPEIVADRCDLILGDLDGDWEQLYVQEETRLPTVHAVFDGPVPAGGGEAVAVDIGHVTRRDFFLVADGACTVDGLTVAIDDDDRDHECAAADLARPNPMARPEILVSRIDAHGVALAPVASRDVEQADPASRWAFDPGIELELLAAFFDDDHRYRERPAGVAFRPASVAHELGSGMRGLLGASGDWADSEPGLDVRSGVGLAELVTWLRRPAALRTLRAHSGPHHAVFASSGDAAALLGVLGEGGSPGLGEAARRGLERDARQGRAGFGFWRVLWQRQAFAAEPQPWLLLHHGCEALSPPGAVAHPYDHPDYDRRGHAASILFFTPAVAILGRAKVFYDQPRGFAETLRAGGSLGDAWRRYFEIESRAASWSEVGGDIGRKRAYFWSVVGDATLGLPPR